jgi:hypothetical protein
VRRWLIVSLAYRIFESIVDTSGLIRTSRCETETLTRLPLCSVSQAPEPDAPAVAPEPSKKEKKTAEQIRKDQERASREELVHPSRKLVHKVFILVSLFTALAALCLAVGEILGIIYNSDGPIDYTLCAYLLLCCLLIFTNELEWTMFTRDSSFLGHWVTRGLFYGFVAVVSLEVNDDEFTAGQTRKNNERAYNISMAYIKAVSYIILGCGAIYFIMGLFCLHRVYNGYVKDYNERVEMAKRIRKAGGASVASPTDVETG